MSIKLSKVHICNYRSIKDITFSLADFTVLFGMNDSGKSNILNALKLGLGNVSVDKNDVHDSPRYPFTQQTSICIDLMFIPLDADSKQASSFDDLWGFQFGTNISVDTTGNEFFAYRTEYSFDEERDEYVRERKVITEWSSEKIETGTSVGYKTLNAFDFILIDAQRDIASDIRDRTSVWSKQISKIKLSREAKTDIEAQLTSLSDRIIEESPFLQGVANDLVSATNKNSAIQISPITRNVDDLYKGLDIFVAQKDASSFPIANLGLGTRSRAVFTSTKSIINARISLVKEVPYFCLVAFEEPEAHVYPNAQKRLMQDFSKISGQKITTTHSPYLLMSSKLESLVHVSMIEGTSFCAPFADLSLEQEELRQIERYVLSTRGDILFSDAVILAEGETEEQALPIFMTDYFGTNPSTLGINVVGVGGQNYYPFLKLLEAAGIKWYIFSDGEQKTITDLKRTLKKLRGSDSLPNLTEYPNIFILENSNNFETYLIEQGYSAEITAAINQVEGTPDEEIDIPFFDYFIEKHHGESLSPRSTGRTCEACGQTIKEKPLRDYKSEGGRINALKDCMKSGKAKYAPAIATAICQSEDENKKYPQKIRALLEYVSRELGV